MIKAHNNSVHGVIVTVAVKPESGETMDDSQQPQVELIKHKTQIELRSENVLCVQTR